jgi:hypothetical protein
LECKKCQENTYAPKLNSPICLDCGFFLTSSSGSEGCGANPIYIIAIILCVTVLGIFFILIITILIIYISYKKNSLFFKNKINKNINYNEDEDGSDLSDGSDISFGDDKNVYISYKK